MWDEKSQAVLKQRIIETARQYFFKYGYSITTTQQIAGAIGISKKTLYKFYQSKEELLLEVLKDLDEEVEQEFRKVLADPNAVFMEKLKSLTKSIISYNSKFSPQFIRDLGRLGPEERANYEPPRRRIFQYVEKLLDDGYRQGMIRTDINRGMISFTIANVIESLINPDVLDQLQMSISEAIEGIFRIVIEGVFTSEAREKFMKEVAGVLGQPL